MIKLDLTEFNRKLEKTAQKTFTQLGDAFQSQLTEEKREFPRTTYREYGRGITGKVAKSPRDVVDSRELVDSYVLTLLGLKANYEWGASHAAKVYLGWITRSGTFIPDYQWCDLGLKEFNVVENFKQNWNNA